MKDSTSLSFEVCAGLSNCTKTLARAELTQNKTKEQFKKIQ